MGFEKFGLVSYVSQTRVSGFIDYLQAGKMCGTKCLKCGYVEFPPRAFCRRCLSDKWEWVPLCGTCKLITFTRIEAAPAAFKEEAPYILGLAQFSEGPRVLAWVDRAIPESSLKAGVSLRLKPFKLKDEHFAYALTTEDST